MSKPKVIATIEARMTSSRLPGKVLMPSGGKPMLQILIERLKRVPRLDGIVVATTVNRDDDAIAQLARNLDVGVFRGSEEDVLGRVCGALESAKADVCVEITGDCPLTDPAVVQEAIDEYLKTENTNPYVSNSDPRRSVPAGLDVQVFSAAALRKLSSETNDPADREHVSLGFYRKESGDKWKPRFIAHESCQGAEDMVVTLDYMQDYQMIKQLHEEVSSKNPFYGAREIIAWIRDHQDLHDRCRISARNMIARV